MANTTNFNIYFSGDADNQPGTPTEPKQEGQPDPNNPTAAKGGLKQVAALATAKQIGKSMFNYTASHVQVYTGSSDSQQKVNFGMSALATGTAIVANPALGIAMLAFNLATKALEHNLKVRQDNMRVSQNLMRAGPSFNRSRMN